MAAIRSNLVQAGAILRLFGPILVARSLRTTTEACTAGLFIGGLLAFAVAGGA